MKVLYFRSTDGTAPRVLAQHAEHAADARVLRDRLNSSCRRDTMIELLGAGDEVLVPCVRHLADTADGAIAAAHRIAARGATLTFIREGLDGATITHVANALGTLGGTDLEPSPMRHRRRRATLEAVDEVVRLSAARRTIAHIALAVGLSTGTVNRIRRHHRPSWVNGGMVHAAAE